MGSRDSASSSEDAAVGRGGECFRTYEYDVEVESREGTLLRSDFVRSTECVRTASCIYLIFGESIAKCR